MRELAIRLPKSPVSSSRYDVVPQILLDRRTYGPENLQSVMQKTFATISELKETFQLRASRSDFDLRVGLFKPTVGGGQISGAMRMRTGGPGSSAKSSLFSEEKPHCFALKDA